MGQALSRGESPTPTLPEGEGEPTHYAY